jgi:phage-related protein
MPRARIVYYAEDNGDVPILGWLSGLQAKVRSKCIAYLTRLEAEGHDLRRPVADYLRDGIYELRPTFGGIHYRILYFFHGHEAIVVSHGLTKEQKVPPAEINRAIARMERFKTNPVVHAFEPSKG